MKTNEILEKVILESLKNTDLNVTKITINNSSRPDLCDYQCNDLFKIAKQNNKNIEELGNLLVSQIKKISNYEDYFNEVEFVKPGFLNITISDKFITQNILKMYNEEKYGIELAKETFVIDFGGANVAKPLHVGHMRTILVGESIRRILEYKGNKTISDVHLGDYGLQMGQVIYGILKENKKEEDIDIKYLDYIYPKMSALCKENEEVKEECSKITKELQDGNKEYKKLWNKIMEVSIKDIKNNYDFLGANFDYWYGESDAYEYLEETEKILKEKNLLEESNGALVVEVKEESDNKEVPPFIFKKSNGAYLYESTDLATILQRKQDFNPDHILYVVDNRQSLHFERVFRTSEKADIMPLSKLEFLGYGTVNGEDGKPYKTRNGKNPKLEELINNVKEIFIKGKETNKDISKEDIDKIANSILKFADLQNSRERDYIFDINKFSNLTGKTGPYTLYTYLRLNKITKNEKININNITNKIYNKYDRQLRIKMLELVSAYEKAYINRMPNFIAEYLYEICVLANSFYEQNHISNLDDKEKANDWLCVMTITEKIIKDMLYLLGIEIPTKM